MPAPQSLTTADTPQSSQSPIVASCHSQAKDLEVLGQSVAQLDSALRSIGSLHTSVSSQVTTAAEETRLRCSTSDANLTQSLDRLSVLVGSISSALADVLTMRQQVLKRSSQVEAIAFQSKILAINASVEAARVGQAGAGFSVVAQEMSRLAHSSRETADDIRNVVVGSEQAVSDLAKHVSELGRQQRTLVVGLREGLNQISTAVGTVVEVSDGSQGQFGSEQATASRICSDIKRGVEDNSRFLSELIGELTGVHIADMTPRQGHESLKWLSVIDVRRVDEFTGDLGHIRDAKLLTLDDTFAERVRQLDPQRLYLFVCRSGGRSSRAARLAQAEGLEHIANLEGGMLAWAKERLPVVR